MKIQRLHNDDTGRRANASSLNECLQEVQDNKYVDKGIVLRVSTALARSEKRKMFNAKETEKMGSESQDGLDSPASRAVN